MTSKVFLWGLLACSVVLLGVTQVMEVDDNGKYVGRGDLMSDVHTTAAAGTTEIAGTLAPGRSFELLAIRVTITDGGDETAQDQSANITLTMDSASGAAYDHLIFSEDYELLGDGIQVVYDPPIPFSGADEIDVEFDATAGADDEIVGIELVYRNAGAQT